MGSVEIFLQNFRENRTAGRKVGVEAKSSILAVGSYLADCERVTDLDAMNRVPLKTRKRSAADNGAVGLGGMERSV